MNLEVITEFKRKDDQKIEDEESRAIKLHVVTLIGHGAGVDFPIMN